MNILFAFHSENATIYYRDPKLGDLPIDPLVSYSASPEQGSRFSHPDKPGEDGVFIVASVPENEIALGCDESLPNAGSFWSPIRCAEASKFDEERELDAFLFISPDYVWKSFKVAK